MDIKDEKIIALLKIKRLKKMVEHIMQKYPDDMISPKIKKVKYELILALQKQIQLNREKLKAGQCF